MGDENPVSIPEPKEEESKEAGSFVRWQTTTRQQLGATINLILTLTLAALGFAMNVLIPKESGSFYPAPSARDIIKWSLALLLTAAFFGICVNLTRLFDFRWTARTIRIREITRSYAKQLEAASSHTTSGTEQPTLSLESALPEVPPWVDRLGRDPWRHRREELKKGGDSPRVDSPLANAPTAAPTTPDPIAADLRWLRDHGRDRADVWGRTTWVLFPCQLAIFFAGIAVLVIGMAFQILNQTPPARKDSTEAGIEKLNKKIDEQGAALSAMKTQMDSLARTATALNERTKKNEDALLHPRIRKRAARK